MAHAPLSQLCYSRTAHLLKCWSSWHEMLITALTRGWRSYAPKRVGNREDGKLLKYENCCPYNRRMLKRFRCGVFMAGTRLRQSICLILRTAGPRPSAVFWYRYQQVTRTIPSNPIELFDLPSAPIVMLTSRAIHVHGPNRIVSPGDG